MRTCLQSPGSNPVALPAVKRATRIHVVPSGDASKTPWTSASCFPPHFLVRRPRLAVPVTTVIGSCVSGLIAITCEHSSVVKLVSRTVHNWLRRFRSLLIRNKQTFRLPCHSSRRSAHSSYPTRRTESNHSSSPSTVSRSCSQRDSTHEW